MSKPSPRDEGCPASHRRFRPLKVVIWLLLIALFFYGASNLWLNSSWGRGVAEAKLKERTGMDWQVQGMTWSPWNGVTVHGAKMLQPEALRDHLDQPLLEVGRIQIQPHWGQLFQGRARIREARIDAPQITVSVEMLAAMASAATQEQSLPQPAPSNAPAPLPSVAENPKPTTPSATPRPREQKLQPPVKKPAKPAAPPAEKKRPPARLAMRLLVKNASLRIVSVNKEIDLLEAESIDLDIPVFGEDAKGGIKIGEVKVPGIESMHDIEQAIVWKRPYLEIEEQTVEIDGLKVRCLAQLAMVRGTPFLLDLVVDPQPLEHAHVLDRFAVDLKAGRVAGKIKATGSLARPMSWESSVIAIAKDLSMREKHSARQIHFDELSVPAVFKTGSLRWSSARIIGEDISILGNGSVSVRDGITAVTRFVVSPGIASVLREAMNGAHIVRAGIPWWADLDTPDRKFKDIYLTGSLMDPEIDMGKRHGVLPLRQTLAATLHFIRVEMKEEGVDLAPLPNRELLNKKHHANH